MLDKIIATVIVLMALLGLHYYDKNNAIQELNREHQRQSAEVITRTERATQALEASSVKDKKELNEKINRISDERDDAIKRLQHRPLRSVSSASSPAGSPCTGAKLPREDAEFLTRESARADRIMEQRDYYWNEYEKARMQLKELNDRQN